jgi:hypothetical protein
MTTCRSEFDALKFLGVANDAFVKTTLPDTHRAFALNQMYLARRTLLRPSNHLAKSYESATPSPLKAPNIGCRSCAITVTKYDPGCR